MTEEALGLLVEHKIKSIEVVVPEQADVGSVLLETLAKDPIKTREEALLEIYRRLRPGDPPTMESSKNLFNSLFFNPSRYDFSRVGRLKFNTKLYGVKQEDWPEEIAESWNKAEDRTPTSARTSSPSSATCSSCAAASVTSTTSTIWAIGASAASASCWRTSSASVWSGWSGRSKRRCRSTRK